MRIPTDAEVLAQVESFLEDSGMTYTRFGRNVNGDFNLVRELRGGRRLTLRTARRIMEFIEDERSRAAA